MGKKPKTIIIDKARKDKIAELYQQNIPIEKIADLTFVNSQIVREIIRIRIAEGTLKDRGRINPKRRTAKPKPIEQPKPKPKIEYFGDGWVRCTKKVSTSCIYGCSETGSHIGLCNYIICVGHSRGCPWEQCTKYVKVDDKHPRLYKELSEPPKLIKRETDSEAAKRYLHER